MRTALEREPLRAAARRLVRLPGLRAAREAAPMSMTFGKRLYLARSARGMSQAQLAAEADIAQSAIWRYEKDVTSPTLVTLRKLSGALGVPIRDLVGE